VQRNHICHQVYAPAAIARHVAERAAVIARAAVEALGLHGVAGVELFLAADGAITINELAPRVHNSGHYTIEACLTSQFENAVRAALGLPLGDTRLVAPAAAMVNVLGARDAPARPAGLAAALAVPGAHVHLYGKRRSRPGRKMGHVTALGATVDEAARLAMAAASCITL
jgi:5-(carboxyamino)imidazole ribonucleotide synthase